MLSYDALEQEMQQELKLAQETWSAGQLWIPYQKGTGQGRYVYYLHSVGFPTKQACLDYIQQLPVGNGRQYEPLEASQCPHICEEEKRDMIEREKYKQASRAVAARLTALKK